MEKIGLASDHAGFDMKEHIKKLLTAYGMEYIDFGTCSTSSCDYPDYAHPLASAVETGECSQGIAVCGSGQGMNMTLNKHQGIRAALCWSKEIAALARQHNNANILVLPGRFLSESEADDIIRTFLNTPFEGGRHENRVSKIPVCL